MRGGYLHNEVMAAELRAALAELGARVRAEYPTGRGRRAGAVDLFAEVAGLKIAIEVELGPRRIENDIRKAETLRADLLLVVAPTAAVAGGIKDLLRTIPKPGVRVQVRTFGCALAYLSRVIGAECGRDKRTTTATRVRGRR